MLSFIVKIKDFPSSPSSNVPPLAWQSSAEIANPSPLLLLPLVPINALNKVGLISLGIGNPLSLMLIITLSSFLFAFMEIIPVKLINSLRNN